MTDIRGPRLLTLKGALFVCLGGLAVAIILVEHPSWRMALLLAVAIWTFAWPTTSLSMSSSTPSTGSSDLRDLHRSSQPWYASAAGETGGLEEPHHDRTYAAS